MPHTNQGQRAPHSQHAKQPGALRWVFLTELWECYAYWSLYALLVLYLTQSLHWGDAKSMLMFDTFNELFLAALRYYVASYCFNV